MARSPAHLLTFALLKATYVSFWTGSQDECNMPPILHDPEYVRNDVGSARRRQPSVGRWTVQIRQLGLAASGAVSSSGWIDDRLPRAEGLTARSGQKPGPNARGKPPRNGVAPNIRFVPFNSAEFC